MPTWRSYGAACGRSASAFWWRRAPTRRRAALGVNIDAVVAVVRRCLWEIGFCFLMAPRHHSAMRHVGPTRVELGTRTIFNLLGPMSNPAGTRRQLVGVFAPEWVVPMAEVLGRLRAARARVGGGSAPRPR